MVDELSLVEMNAIERKLVNREACGGEASVSLPARQLRLLFDAARTPGTELADVKAKLREAEQGMQREASRAVAAERKIEDLRVAVRNMGV